ncbi:DUF362 domain-containing protein [Candidatus Pacearchaeota archaeon]|nr:DUF362 domain-containing protein [Candidatus Pacearchaeota archaeon]
MAKGASIKFKSYEESVPKLLEILKLQREIKKHDKILLKITLSNSAGSSTSVNFTEAVLKFIIENKNPVTEIFIAEGADGEDTGELFAELGYRKLAEKYEVSLVDLNNTETREIENYHFSKFSTINFPKIMLESFVISLSRLAEDEETIISGALPGMLGAFPESHYKGFFSRGKSKIRKWPIKYSIHDITKCKMPDFAITDASIKSYVLAGLPLEIDKQAAKLLDKDWKTIPHLKLIDESSEVKEKKPTESIEYTLQEDWN